MDRKFLQDLGLEKDVIDKVLSQAGADITAVKTRLDTKEAEIKTLRDDLVTANTKLAELQKVDVVALQKELDDERAGRTKDKQEWALRAALTEAKCKDVDYVMYKLGDSVQFGDDNALKDKEAVIKTATESYAAMFEQEQPAGTGGLGNFPRSHSAPEKSTKDMTYTELAAYMESHPEAKID